jgi:very-short-patch-repair endonuclease
VSGANDVTGGGCFRALAARRCREHLLCGDTPHPTGLRPPHEGDEREPALANENARALRKRLTPQEVKLWVKLRELKPLGFHFRRQAPIGRYIVDFVSFRSHLVVEADGGQHGMPGGAQSDQLRDAFLQSQGFNVLRFWNSDIDANLTGVMDSILNALRDPPPDRPAAGHPPHEGEG